MKCHEYNFTITYWIGNEKDDEEMLTIYEFSPADAWEELAYQFYYIMRTDAELFKDITDVTIELTEGRY